MAGSYIIGETKVRPGAYFNIGKDGGNQATGAVNGITATCFKSDFGPLNEAVELTAEESYASVFGNGGTTDLMEEAIQGGAKTIIACRVGNGGTKGNIKLASTSGSDGVTISAKYPGSKAFTVTVREKMTDSTLKECIIYDGVTEFEKVEFTAGVGETKALAEALKSSKNFDAVAGVGTDSDTITNVTQLPFTQGTDPATTSADYSNAFAQIEPYTFNTICVDTEDNAVHLLLQAFVKRIVDNGSFAQAVVAEKQSIALETRMAHASAFNDEKMNYILNAKINQQGTEIDGYQTAGRIAGMIGAVAANSSLTHTVVSGFTEILEKLTNSQIIAAEKKGCIVLSYNSEKQVWIDSAINTLVTPADNQDDGWKKVRRVKTRFEMLRRMNATNDALIGKVDNDANGRATAIASLNEVGATMIAEGKLTACTVSESETYIADGDSAWFDIAVTDKDSLEKIYAAFKFRFSTNV